MTVIPPLFVTYEPTVKSNSEPLSTAFGQLTDQVRSSALSDETAQLAGAASMNTTIRRAFIVPSIAAGSAGRQGPPPKDRREEEERREDRGHGADDHQVAHGRHPRGVRAGDPAESQDRRRRGAPDARAHLPDDLRGVPGPALAEADHELN